MMGTDVWKQVEDAPVWLVKIEKAVAKELTELEGHHHHIYSYIQERGGIREIYFSWNEQN